MSPQKGPLNRSRYLTPKKLNSRLTTFCHVLFGGDQLTVAHARGAQTVLGNSHNESDCLEGLVPVVEDWHAKVTFMKVIPDPVVACMT